MDDFRFENVKVLFGEIDRNARDGLKSALYHHGFRDVRITDSMSVIDETASNDAVDLLVCNTEYADGDVHDVIRKIRHHEIGSNPFVLIIMLTENLSKGTIRKAINSGPDDILAKPISAAKLYERIVNLTRDRKRFIVTSDYIGPDRRKTPRPGTEKIPEIEVPNPLKILALDDVHRNQLQEDIKRCSTLINELKIERYAVQIAYLAEQILSCYAGGMADADVTPHLNRLVSVSKDICCRLERFDHAKKDHKEALCQPMVELAGRVRADPSSRDPHDIDLLRQLAEDIRSAFHGKRIAAQP